MKKALVTGSAGFVGRHMVKELKARGWAVERCDPLDPDSVKLDAHLIFDEHREDRVYDLVVHAAATAPYRAAIDSTPMNLVSDLSLDAAMFEWAANTRQRHVVYLSSSATYPIDLQERSAQPYRLRECDIDPLFPMLSDASYGLTKLTGEHMAQALRGTGVKVTVVRPFSGYGEDQGENWPFGAFIGRALRREDPFTVWGDGTQVRDWIHIEDVVNGILALVDGNTEEPVNLCTGRGTSMTEMIYEMCRQIGYTPRIDKKLDAPDGVHYRVGDPRLLHNWYRPQVTVEEGIRRTLRARGV